MSRNLENNSHYSNQTGHRERGVWHKARKKFEKEFLEVPFFKPLAEEEYRMRRTMFRDQQDGRRKR